MGGEEALIQTYFAPLASGLSGAFGLLDDCAALPPREGHDVVVTTDAVASGVHFFSDDAPEDIGWKALAVNVSDLAAKGASPAAYVMSLAFPSLPDASWIRGFAGGLAAAQAQFGLALAGGDTDRRPGPLAISITALGYVPTGRMVRRATARPGDAIFISGTIGDSTLGLKLRGRPEFAAEWGLDAAGAAMLLARYLRPQPPLALASALLKCASAAMDVSDGLAKDLDRLARASGVAARVVAEDVPLSKAAAAVLARKPDLLPDLLSGGDDYEVLATVPRGRCADFCAEASAGGINVTEIGEIAVGSGTLICASDARPLVFAHTGYDHFA